MNNTALILKDGKVYAFNMPENPKHDVKCHSRMACICASLAFENGANRDVVDGYDNNCPHKYNKAVEQAISSAVECLDQEHAKKLLRDFHADGNLLQSWKTYHPYVIPGLTFTVIDQCETCDAFYYQDCKAPDNDCDVRNQSVALLSLTEIKEEKTDTCPKCRTTDFKSCHSMHCPKREVEETTEKLEDMPDLVRAALDANKTLHEYYPQIRHDIGLIVINRLKEKFTITRKS
jgi:hypothetical protein